MASRTVVLLHGWSVHHTDTYGGLPEQLARFGTGDGTPLDLREIRLGRYISFRDEVRMPDLVRALESAVRTELADLIAASQRFVVITHSTGGPLAREWWARYYGSSGDACPMSHLIMLAPANFGSALAQLGKGKVGQLKALASSIEPGQGVLDWLELGSPESWALNERWIRRQFKTNATAPVYQAVITGQTIDRKLYDFVNSYTGELGSDGVVRVAAANLNATLLRLEQDAATGTVQPTELPLRVRPQKVYQSARTAFRLLPGAAHSGEDIGIMRAIKPDAAEPASLVQLIQRVVSVENDAQYESLCSDFDAESQEVFDFERCELERVRLMPDRKYIHDAMSMLIFRVSDSDGAPVTDFDLLLTGPEGDPNRLPSGFFKDRQRNSRAKNTVTYFVNHALLFGSEPVRPAPGSEAARDVAPGELPPVWRDAQAGVDALGLLVIGRPAEGFAHYLPAQFLAPRNELAAAIRAHQTLLIDIVLQRIVRSGAVVLGRGDEPREDFKKAEYGAVIPNRQPAE